MSRSHAPILDVSGLTIIRDGTRILDRVSWRVEPGEHWVLIGANGSGKTSLLSALIGYLMPTEGEMELLGCRFGESDWRELRCRIGLVSSSLRQMMADTEPALLSVVGGRYAMIDLWGEPTRSDRREALRLLERVEAAHLKDRPWAVLSQGERQRVLIARALMACPQLLILDEPCAGLDPVAREHFLQFLERLSRQPDAPSLVLVTHHVEEITPLFTHALLLSGGRVVAAGPRKTALRSETLSRMFGSPVRLKSRSGRLSLEVQAATAQVM
ncbi:MAG: ABC transporter ATP-binding protein [Verrucomicrobia bacterium]|nr:ABC transporter ATP-binding protein [Verrucomicrobiota bacterium]